MEVTFINDKIHKDGMTHEKDSSNSFDYNITDDIVYSCLCGRKKR